LETYTLFLLAEAKYQGCTRLAEIMGDLSHDSVNRFLLRERYEPKDLFDEVRLIINLIGGTLSGDDSIIDKPYSDPKLAELIDYFWSGKHHKTVKGICLITLSYTDLKGRSIPERKTRQNGHLVRELSVGAKKLFNKVSVLSMFIVAYQLSYL